MTTNPQSEIQPAPVSANDGTLDNSVAKATAALDAEIHWCMKVVESHSSYRLCLNLKLLFQKMFPDSDIASKFAMSKTKCGYFITHGIAPFYKSGLLKEINLSPFYSVLFGESLNNLIQKEQIDVQIRFWNDEKAYSETRYLVSSSLGQMLMLYKVRSLMQLHRLTPGV